MTVDEVMARLRAEANPQVREGMARFGIVLGPDRALGLTTAAVKRLAKEIGRDHDLAGKLWKTGVYEARTLAALIDEPGKVTARRMDEWAKDFDNWAIVDTVCFHLFDRVPHAFAAARRWAARKGEFQRRAGFALMWALGAHAKSAPPEEFESFLPLLEVGAKDERHYVAKAVDMAIRSIGRRPALRAAVSELAGRLAKSADPNQARIGRHVVRDFAKKAAGRRRAAE